VTKWFASTRHYSRVLAAKKEKHPGNYSAENNDRMAEDNIRQIEPNGRVLKTPTVDGTDNFSEDRMAQANPDEGNKEDTPFTQDISYEQTLVVTPTLNQNRTTNSREVGSPNGVPGGNQYSGNSRNAADTPPRQAVGLNQTVPMTPVNQKYTPDTSSVGSPGVSGGTQRSGTPRNVGSPRGKKAEFPGLEHVDEARRKAILRELRKMKKGR
jgi:remodeling and spacing factor 1